MMTKQEAKSKWCPFSRPSFPRADDCGYQPGNRDAHREGDKAFSYMAACIGSDCMAWRVAIHPSQRNLEERDRTPLGYCGLAGPVSS